MPQNKIPLGTSMLMFFVEVSFCKYFIKYIASKKLVKYFCFTLLIISIKTTEIITSNIIKMIITTIFKSKLFMFLSKVSKNIKKLLIIFYFYFEGQDYN